MRAMSETLFIPRGEQVGRQEIYEAILPQIEQVLAGKDELIANLANTAAMLKEAFGFFWVGFYLVKSNELVLGPFQGPLACTRIGKGRGVCGSCWQQAETMLVPDVEAFPGHIACSSASRSEIVVPILVHGEVVAVLDIDSDQLNDFNATDQCFLEKLAQCLSKHAMWALSGY